ncbi:MAG: hypothetical protein KY469_15535 [Actinobacteria bacterium]|nr:hypothetical protein [Actinomycetota bacterium]
MARVKLLSAMAFDEASFAESGIADPALRVYGELPATARPFRVQRVYQGAQGTYEEALLLLDPDDVVIWERPYRFIELRGEMFEDRFDGLIREDIKLGSADEHTLVFLIDGAEAGRIPVFVDAPESASALGVLDEAMQDALKRGAIIWLRIPQPDGRVVGKPAWYVLDGGRIYVLSGPSEQILDDIEHADQVEVHVKSKDLQATVAVADADVEVIDNHSDEFDRIATLGMGTRLNLPDGDGALERWRNSCVLVALSPLAR